MLYRCWAALAVIYFIAQLQAAAPEQWVLARSQHFEVYAQAGAVQAREVLNWLEQVRAFFIAQGGEALETRAAVRVIGFRSVEEYEPYRLRSTADAYYVGTDNRDYMVMAFSGPAADLLRVAAHEYAHVLLHAAGTRWPAWFSEGLAEFLSTLRISDTHLSVGGDLPAHTQRLQTAEWIPLRDLMKMGLGDSALNNRRTGAIFYAESWALVELLFARPEYTKLLPELVSGTPSPDTLARMERDLRVFAGERHQRISMPVVQRPAISMEEAPVSQFKVRALMAELVSATGALERAEGLYAELAKDAPENAEISAARAVIALQRGDIDRAKRLWSAALSNGLRDAGVCLRFAMLAENVNLAAVDIRAALERAVAMDPTFDDALYHLALLEKNLGDYRAAVEHFQRIRSVPRLRAFAYWSALSDAFNELGERAEAVGAARKAAEFAQNARDRERADQLAYMANTDLTVQMAQDANGRAQMVTTRKLHGDETWNPFIQPGEQIRRTEAKLLQIDCDGGPLRFEMQADSGMLILFIPDTTRVLLRNAPREFTCGEQPEQAVLVEYVASGAHAGIIRGLLFR